MGVADWAGVMVAKTALDAVVMHAVDATEREGLEVRLTTTRE